MDTTTSQTTQNQVATQTEAVEKNEVNIYPILRSTLLALAVIICIIVILYLLYLNGKSVYESGV